MGGGHLVFFMWSLSRKLSAAAGILEHAEIDTAHFKGNFPDSCEIHGLFADPILDWKTHRDESPWDLILSRTRLGPHRQHYLQLENTEDKVYTHIRLTIYPDGGLQRIRILGRILHGKGTTAADKEGLIEPSPVLVSESSVAVSEVKRVVPVLPLTPEAFAPFGQVIQAYEDLATAPKGTRITPANGGSASKFHKLSLLESSYPSDAGATTGISVYRCQPSKDISDDGTVDLKVLERHQSTNQAFIPMGRGSGEGLSDPGSSYLVVVAKNGSDDRPDISSLRAFVASTAQGIVYGTSIWRESDWSAQSIETSH